jgi:hypothetical protein
VNVSCSMFSQILKLIPRTDFSRWRRGNGGSGVVETNNTIALADLMRIQAIR